MSVVSTNARAGVSFHSFPKKLKLVAALGVFALGCAASPLSAKTITDSDDDPYSDVLAQPQPSATVSTAKNSDARFASLMSSWRGMDGPASTSIFSFDAPVATADIPSGRPVERLELTSNYGVRYDPFNGHARMHKGVDIPGPVGTPVYATADGYVLRSQWVRGYGNLVEISHGNDFSTRYGHLSKLIVQPYEMVRRGQLIGLMGSTGRSTGSHLHYEVRVAGEAVNPMPFVVGAGQALAVRTKKDGSAVGGPAE